MEDKLPFEKPIRENILSWGNEFLLFIKFLILNLTILSFLIAYHFSSENYIKYFIGFAVIMLFVILFIPDKLLAILKKKENKNLRMYQAVALLFAVSCNIIFLNYFYKMNLWKNNQIVVGTWISQDDLDPQFNSLLPGTSLEGEETVIKFLPNGSYYIVGTSASMPVTLNGSYIVRDDSSVVLRVNTVRVGEKVENYDIQLHFELQLSPHSNGEVRYYYLRDEDGNIEFYKSPLDIMIVGSPTPKFTPTIKPTPTDRVY